MKNLWTPRFGFLLFSFFILSLFLFQSKFADDDFSSMSVEDFTPYSEDELMKSPYSKYIPILVNSSFQLDSSGLYDGSLFKTAFLSDTSSLTIIIYPSEVYFSRNGDTNQIISVNQLKESTVTDFFSGDSSNNQISPVHLSLFISMDDYIIEYVISGLSFQEVQSLYLAIYSNLKKEPTNMLTAEASADEAIIFDLMEAFFQKYMDGQVSLTHPDFSDIVIDNANTQLYSAMINYDIDTNEVYGTVIDDYDLTVEVENINIQDKFASAEVRFCSVHHYAHLGERQTSAWKIPFYFQFVKTGTDWKIEHIDGQDYRFKNLEEELNSPEMQSLYENQPPQDILSKKLEDLRNSDLNLLLYGDENSEESQNKIADAQVRTSSVS